MNFHYKRCIEAKGGSGSNDNLDIARHFESHNKQEVFSTAGNQKV